MRWKGWSSIPICILSYIHVINNIMVLISTPHITNVTTPTNITIPFIGKYRRGILQSITRNVFGKVGFTTQICGGLRYWHLGMVLRMLDGEMPFHRIQRMGIPNWTLNLLTWCIGTRCYRVWYYGGSCGIEFGTGWGWCTNFHVLHYIVRCIRSDCVGCRCISSGCHVTEDTSWNRLEGTHARQLEAERSASQRAGNALNES